MSTPDERTRALLAAAHESPLRRALLSQALPEHVAAGQLWRVRWADTSALALTLGEARDGVVPVVMVTVGVNVPGGTAAAVVPLDSVVVREAVAWPTVGELLPLRTFDVLIELSEATRSIAEALGVTGPGTAGEILDPFDPAAELKAELEDELAELAAAPGLSVADPAQPWPRLSELIPGDTLGKLAALQGVLGMSQATVRVALGAVRACGDTAQVVGDSVNEFHVAHLDAPTHPAQVIDGQALGDRAVDHFPRSSMGVGVPPVVAELAVAIPVVRPEVDQAGPEVGAGVRGSS